MSLVEHLEKLRHFHKVTAYKSINEASKGIGMSQAGLSKSIAGLETALKTLLFLRTRDGLILTKEGELLLKATDDILRLASSVEANLRSLKASQLPETVRVGMYDSISIYFFSDLSSYIKTIYPTVTLELVVDKSANLAALVEGEELDLAIGVNLNQKKGIKTEFFFLFEDHYSFYVAPDKESESSNLPLIFHPEASDGAGIENKKHLAPVLKNRPSHVVYNFETIKTLSSQGVGIGVLPTQVAKPLSQQKMLVSTTLPKFPRLFGKHTIGFVASMKFLKGHREFAEDIYRLGERWSKT